MSFKKQKWMKYGSSADFIEIVVKDASGRRIDSFKCNHQKAYKNILRIIKDNYNFDFEKKDENKEKNEEDYLKEAGIL